MSNVFDIRTGRVVAATPAAPAATLAAPAATLAAPAAPIAAALLLAVGCTVENGTLRMHRYRDHLVLWDLTVAGKRGKKVAKLTVVPSYALTASCRDQVMEQISVMVEALRSFSVAAAAISEYASTFSPALNLTLSVERGVDVKPAGVQKITIETAKLSLEAEPLEFTVRCKVDQNNCPTAISPSKNSRKAAAAFYRWASENEGRIQAMSYHEVLVELGRLGIRYHDYCAMD